MALTATATEAVCKVLNYSFLFPHYSLEQKLLTVILSMESAGCPQFLEDPKRFGTYKKL
jgi:hypothetical protein